MYALVHSHSLLASHGPLSAVCAVFKLTSIHPEPEPSIHCHKNIFINVLITQDQNQDPYNQWWASSSNALLYPSIFAFPLLPLHHQSTAMHPCTNAITLALSDKSHLFDGHMFSNSHVLFLFLVSPMCTLPWSNQSWALTLCGQALSIALLQMSLMLSFLLTICI